MSGTVKMTFYTSRTLVTTISMTTATVLSYKQKTQHKFTHSS